MTPEKAIEKPVLNREIKIITVYKGIDNEFTGSQREITKHFGINYNIFLNRTKLGMTPEEAIEKPVNGNIKIITVYKGTDREFTGSLIEIANRFGINYTTFKGRINSGMTPEEAIENRIGSITVYKGSDKEFTGSHIEIAEHFGIKYGTFKDRIKSGITLEEAVEKPLLKKSAGTIITVYKGTNKEFTGSKTKIAEHFGIKYGTFDNRIKSGMTPEDAIEKPTLNTDIKIITIYKGTDKEFTGNLKEIANHFGINYATFIKRIQSGMIPEKAVEKFIVNTNVKIMTVYKGTNKEFTGNLKEIVDHFGINYSSFRSRIKSGMTPEEAIEKPITHMNIKIITIYKDTDKEFTGNLKEIANHFEINYYTLNSRVSKSGMTPEEAIEIPVSKVHQNHLAYK